MQVQVTFWTLCLGVSLERVSKYLDVTEGIVLNQENDTSSNTGAATYQLGYTSSRTIIKVKQR